MKGTRAHLSTYQERGKTSNLSLHNYLSVQSTPNNIFTRTYAEALKMIKLRSNITIRRFGKFQYRMDFTVYVIKIILHPDTTLFLGTAQCENFLRHFLTKVKFRKTVR